MDEAEFPGEKLNAKEVILHNLVKFYFPNRRWNSENLLEEIRFSELHLDKVSSKIEEKCNMTFLENQTGFHQQQSMKSLRVTTQSIQWSATTSPTAKNYVEKYFGKIGHELLQQADSRHRLQEKPVAIFFVKKNLAMST